MKVGDVVKVVSNDFDGVADSFIGQTGVIVEMYRPEIAQYPIEVRLFTTGYDIPFKEQELELLQ
jgi:hypothetical protein